MRGGPDDVVVREEYRWPFVMHVRALRQVPVSRHEAVQDNLLIACPVAAVGEDEDGFDLGLFQIDHARVLVFLLRQFAEGRCILLRLDYVAGCDDVLESVFPGDVAALLAFAADYKDGVVSLGHFAHGRVPADELAGAHLVFELAA